MKEWRYVKPLLEESLIEEAEDKLKYRFTTTYVDFIKKYNGARPPVNKFITSTGKERTIKSFLSFNPSDKENILNLNRSVSDFSKSIVVFAVDDFGNYICFDKNNNNILFFDFESEEMDVISETFTDFLVAIDQ